MIEQTVEGALVEALRRAVTHLPADVERALKRARADETSPRAAEQIDVLLENVTIARDDGVPLCQDTGLLRFHVDAGSGSPYLYGLRSWIESAVACATDLVPLRPNTIDPLTFEHRKDNLGHRMPWIEWDLVEGGDVTISILPKGGGSDGASRLCLLPVDAGRAEIQRTVIEHIVAWEGRTCPPVVIGLGIGGPADGALSLGTRALLRDLDTPHPDPEIAVLENEIRGLANATGVGAMGLGGAATCLAVHIEIAHRHPACFPLGIVVSCWADRRAKVVLHADGSVEVLPP
ncbi:MAG: fumarate hydratase [Candidatus Bipolaricaulis sp.]|nr:fumarate hydratase [Candidatus Bipolaricaulis sp.]